jgi:integral membrane protein
VTAAAAEPTVATTSGVVIRYRVMAWVTGVVLATSCLVGLSFWPWYVGEGAAGVLWTAHGYLYLVYVAVAFHLAYRLRWKPVRTVLVLLAGTIPLMSFVAERRVTADLRRQEEQATGPAPAAPAPPA